jgi:hypothetical protein
VGIVADDGCGLWLDEIRDVGVRKTPPDGRDGGGREDDVADETETDQ